MQLKRIRIQIRNPGSINHIFCYSLEKQTEQKKLKINNKLDISPLVNCSIRLEPKHYFQLGSFGNTVFYKP
jgi:hypothetical protein